MEENFELSLDKVTGGSEATEAVLQDALGAVTTYVDIVFCIDCTGSMAPIIDTVKDLTLGFYDDLIKTMADTYQRRVETLRVKVIAFRDYYCDGNRAMQESKFLNCQRKKSYSTTLLHHWRL